MNDLPALNNSFFQNIFKVNLLHDVISSQKLLLHQSVGKGATLFPGLLLFTLDSYLIMLSVK